MYKIVLFLAVLVPFASCKKTNDAVSSEDTTPETIKEMNISVTGPDYSDYQSVHQGTANYNFLGYGYDVIGKYADTSSVKAQVIDIEGYAAATESVYYNYNTSFEDNLLYAANAEDFSERLSLRMKESPGNKLFRKTLTTAFPGNDAISDKYIYAQYEYTASLKKISSYFDYPKVEKFLTNGFRDDIKNLTPENLVKKYGTHVLESIVLGGKFNVYFQAKTTAEDRYRSSIKGFTYVLNKEFAIKSATLDEPNPAEINKISTPKLAYEAVGGDPSKITKLQTAKGTIINAYDWMKTCTLDNAKFIDIARVTPLYQLITDPAKKAEVKAYITSYLEQNQAKL